MNIINPNKSIETLPFSLSFFENTICEQRKTSNSFVRSCYLTTINKKEDR